MDIKKRNYDFYVLEAVLIKEGHCPTGPAIFDRIHELNALPTKQVEALLTQSELDDVFARFICNQPISGTLRVPKR